MITSAGLNSFATAMLAQIATAYVVVGGVEKLATIQSTSVVNGLVTVNIYLDDSINGTVTKFRLKKNDGTILIEQSDNVSKPAEKGLLTVIKFTVTEVAG